MMARVLYKQQKKMIKMHVCQDDERWQQAMVVFTEKFSFFFLRISVDLCVKQRNMSQRNLKVFLLLNLIHKKRECAIQVFLFILFCYAAIFQQLKDRISLFTLPSPSNEKMQTPQCAKCKEMTK